MEKEVKDPAQHHIFFMGDPLVTSSRKRTAARDENELLPDSFEPGNKDVICGRARENFHHGKCHQRTEGSWTTRTRDSS